ncbi:unnamed protein product [Malus baccata var. baccata]
MLEQLFSATIVSDSFALFCTATSGLKLSRNEGAELVADGGGFAPAGLRLVRVLRHLGPPPRRLLQIPLTEVHGRTFGVWTLLTCTLCYLCAFNLENKPLYLATFLSFVYALGHFLSEYLTYQTMAIANLSTVSFFAGTAIVWMLLQWNAHQAQPVLKSERSV